MTAILAATHQPPGTQAPPSWSPADSHPPLQVARSVSSRLLARVLTVYVLVSALIFVLETGLQYRQLRQQIVTEVDTLLTVFSGTVSYALWNMDDRQLEYAVSDIARMPVVVEASLISATGAIINTKRGAPHHGWLARQFKPRLLIGERLVTFMRSGEPVALGKLRISSDERQIIDQLEVGMVVSLVSAIARTTLLLGLFSLYFDLILSRPLNKLARHAAALEPEQPPLQRLPVKAGVPDELDVIASAINSLAGAVEGAMSRQRGMADGLNSQIGLLQQTRDSLIEAEKMASLGALAVGVAHEITTPVGLSLTGSAHLNERVREIEARQRRGELGREELELFLEEARDLSRSMQISLSRSADLVRSLNLVAADQRGGELRVFTPAAYVRDVVAAHTPALRQQGTAVHVQADAELQLFGDPGAWAQVLSNLVGNARIHAFQPSDDRPRQISIRVQADDDTLLLSFEDNGAGMAPEVAARLFQPFLATDAQPAGDGLGLHIVHHLVTQRLHGSITVDSHLGVGTTFLIRLPRQALPESGGSTMRSNSHVD